jgi:hypothetical protein
MVKNVDTVHPRKALPTLRFNLFISSMIEIRTKADIRIYSAMTAKGVRRDKAALYQWVRDPPG